MGNELPGVRLPAFVDAGVENFLDGIARNIRIAVYDASTLEYRRSIDWNAESGQQEVSGVAVDPANDAIWMTDWMDGTRVYRYQLSTGRYGGKMRLDPVPPAPQGTTAPTPTTESAISSF